MSLRTILLVLTATVSQAMLMVLPSGTSLADELIEPDGDWPTGAAVFIESVVSGNPLDEGDAVYGVRGTHRFFRGDLGLEFGIARGEPTSDFVRRLGGDAELLLADLSLVWYPGYQRWYGKAQKSEPWHGGRRFKPEVVVFGGPGWASLRIDDAFPNFPLSDASKDYFTVNGGVGVEIHWMRTDDARGWDHRTSRWYVRPEVRGRWFSEDSGEVDWSVGLSLGVQFGRRPSLLALRLKAREACKDAESYVDGDVARFLEDDEKAVRTTERLEDAEGMAEELAGYREGLMELRAYAVTCGHRCRDLRPELQQAIDAVNGALARLHPGAS